MKTIKNKKTELALNFLKNQRNKTISNSGLDKNYTDKSKNEVLNLGLSNAYSQSLDLFSYILREDLTTEQLERFLKTIEL